MQTAKSKNKTSQLPTQVEAAPITINQDDVSSAIQRLSHYEDCYSTGIVKVFTSYLTHKDYKRMRDELEEVPRVNASSYNLWDFSTHAGFLEVIYPITKEGGDHGK